MNRLPLVIVVACGFVVLVPGAAAAIDLPGTQPNELTAPFRTPSDCANCHANHGPESAVDTWQGSMMANAARDPIFQAALTIANQDVPGAGDLCIRCHSPRAWLSGRSSNFDLSDFIESDYESVDCDFCHRLSPGPDGSYFVGNGQYWVADDFVRRGPIADAMTMHETLYDPWFEDSGLCGTCHDVSNPLEGGFAIERTYTEWLSSAFPMEGTTCQTCHMPSVEGHACGAPFVPERTIHQHDLIGGNTWVPRVLAGEHPELGRGDAYARTVELATQMLEDAALVSLEAPDSAQGGTEVELWVRVENLTGHKLPTGYPEGRRMWLEVRAVADNGALVFESGTYNFEVADRLADDQLRVYEVMMADDGVEGFHFMLQNELVFDTRIPPRGFVPAADTQPVGRSYEEQTNGSLAHWDLAPYRFELPEDLDNTLQIEVTLWYQTISREYVEFLRDENVTDDLGDRLHDLWERYDRAPPIAMAVVSTSLMVTPAPTLSLDRETEPFDGVDTSVTLDAKGPRSTNDDCSCSLRRTSDGWPPRPIALVMGILLMFGWGRNRRSNS